MFACLPLTTELQEAERHGREERAHTPTEQHKGIRPFGQVGSVAAWPMRSQLGPQSKPELVKVVARNLYAHPVAVADGAPAAPTAEVLQQKGTCFVLTGSTLGGLHLKGSALTRAVHRIELKSGKEYVKCIFDLSLPCFASKLVVVSYRRDCWDLRLIQAMLRYADGNLLYRYNWEGAGLALRTSTHFDAILHSLSTDNDTVISVF